MYTTYSLFYCDNSPPEANQTLLEQTRSMSEQVYWKGIIIKLYHCIKKQKKTKGLPWVATLSILFSFSCFQRRNWLLRKSVLNYCNASHPMAREGGRVPGLLTCPFPKAPCAIPGWHMDHAFLLSDQGPHLSEQTV